MPLTRLIYSKKCILPSKAAHVLQSLNMAYSFAEKGVHTTMWPGFLRNNQSAFRESMERDYGLEPTTGLKIHPLPGFHKGLYGLIFRACLLREWLRAPQNTVFYARDITEALLLARFKRLLPIRHPVFYEIHELLSEQQRILKTGRDGHFARVETEILAAMDGVVCISPVLVDGLKSVYGFAGPTLVAPMGYNPRLFQVAPDVDFSGQITIAYVGSLYESKGIHNLVRAMGYLPARFRLLVVGGNPNRELECLRALARDMPGGRERIEFCGYLPQSELFPRLASCAMMTIPQSSEAEFFSPIKLYEAIGMGLPLVATPIPALTSVLERDVDAVIAEGTSPQALADAVVKMVSDWPRARRMQEHLRRRAAESTWGIRAAACLDFMAEVSKLS
ncbi:MAG: glycosyltransferase [Proteobacteria bacterium]|jgi:glycosyltransferase involved in cell wall biosynthesis|nr:glycosyltransferase [Pseudomonadota bacterium]